MAIDLARDQPLKTIHDKIAHEIQVRVGYRLDPLWLYQCGRFVGCLPRKRDESVRRYPCA